MQMFTDMKILPFAADVPDTLLLLFFPQRVRSRRGYYFIHCRIRVWLRYKLDAGKRRGICGPKSCVLRTLIHLSAFVFFFQNKMCAHQPALDHFKQVLPQRQANDNLCKKMFCIKTMWHLWVPRPSVAPALQSMRISFPSVSNEIRSAGSIKKRLNQVTRRTGFQYLHFHHWR